MPMGERLFKYHGLGNDFVLVDRRAGLVDHLHVAIAPILLGRGNRLWDDLRGLELTHKLTTDVAESGTVHVTFAR